MNEGKNPKVGGPGGQVEEGRRGGGGGSVDEFPGVEISITGSVGEMVCGYLL